MKHLIHFRALPLLAVPWLIGTGNAAGQNVSVLSGTVQGRDAFGKREPVPFAFVAAMGQAASTSADQLGHFKLEAPLSFPLRLVASAVGYANDTLFLEQPSTGITLTLPEVIELRATEVIERQAGTRMDLRATQGNERITAKELKRAACCDVSESFESNATVDVSYSDAVSGAKRISMLGLDGRYVQMGMENIPFVRGLSSAYGFTLVPGPWIREINVSKGIGTAVNGPNAMTGQIDLCLQDPYEAPPLFTNLYANNQGRTELNVNTGQHWGKAGANLLMVQGSMNQRDMDDNGDGFRDQPLTRRFNIMDRWLQQKGRRTTQLIARYVTDARDGGHTDAHRPGEGPAGRHYTVHVANEMADVLAKNGWILRDSTKSIGILASFRNHTLSSNYGDRTYEGAQLSGYGSVVYQQLIGARGDQMKVGAAFQYDAYHERFIDSTFARTERMPGLFAEYTRSREKLTIVAGLRADHNSVFGTAVSPRLHAKYAISPLTALRLSAGHAFRTALPFVENAGVLASSRNIVVEGPLGMERSWNFGISLLHKWKWLGRKWELGIDAYRSEFTQQVVADLDRSPRTMAIYMLHGPSFANSVLADVQVELSSTLRAKASYRWYDVRATYDGVLRERPFTPRHRGLVDLAYESRNERWRFDIFTNLFGTSRLPRTAANPKEYRLPERAPAYATLNAQVTWALGALEVYIGGENLTSATQHRQILAPEDPFGPYFDASMIWGPTQGAMVYGGFRHTLKRKDPKP
ncbi:MAG: TonB-dependent receptor [Bacteroidetes bacterium]|nr:TonB-dependent receptor [Bacteroidota bacterium]MBX7128614.1 TonB-dependent receptor [Flavobacteriales bacterium]MCC6654476.1 TonB-dependent receptor [Flavobacteriales bacterium]HMU15489.1 TonB-dependent receptor [Flavobacteriales bacterium]HNA32760.1 TonB-dependent receptor [Flavobacteriales bacterium]